MALNQMREFAQKFGPTLLLAVIVAFGAVLRLSLMTESLWIDELHTAWTVDGTFFEVFSRAKMGNQGPVYFVAMWLWTQLFGSSEIALRLPSWLAGVALPVVVYVAVRRVDLEKHEQTLVALLAAFFAATDPYAVFYSQEARPYAWVMVGSVLHFSGLVLWLRHPRRWQMACLVVGAAILFFLHYTTALLFAAEAAYVLVIYLYHLRTQSSPRNALQVSLRQLLLLPIGVAILCLPAIPSLKLLVERRQNWEAFVEAPAMGDFWHTFPGTLAILVILFAYLCRVVLGRKLAAGSDEDIPVNQRLELWAAIWLLIPLSTAWAASHWNVARIFFPRYLVAALPASWIVLGQSVRSAEVAMVRWLLAGLIVFLWCDQAELQRSMYGSMSRNENWRGALQFVNEHFLDAPGTLFINPGLIEAREFAQDHRRLSAEMKEYLLLPLRANYQVAAEDVRPFFGPPDWSFLYRDDTSYQPIWVLLRESDAVVTAGGYYNVARDSPWQLKYNKNFGKVHVLCFIPPTADEQSAENITPPANVPHPLPSTSK